MRDIILATKLVEIQNRIQAFLTTLVKEHRNLGLGPFRCLPQGHPACNGVSWVSPFKYTIVLMEADGRPLAWLCRREGSIIFDLTQAKHGGFTELDVRSLRSWSEQMACELTDKMGQKISVEIWSVDAASAYMELFGQLCEHVGLNLARADT